MVNGRHAPSVSKQSKLELVRERRDRTDTVDMVHLDVVQFGRRARETLGAETGRMWFRDGKGRFLPFVRSVRFLCDEVFIGDLAQLGDAGRVIRCVESVAFAGQGVSDILDVEIDGNTERIQS